MNDSSEIEVSGSLTATDGPIPSAGTCDAAEILLAKIAGGDHQALAQLFGQYARVVHAIAGRILRDDGEADDFVQDLFLFIQRKAVIFDRTKSSASSWIVQMTYQRAIERRRHLACRHFYNREDLQRTANEVFGLTTTEQDYSAESVFGRNGLVKILRELSGRQQETLRLYFFEGYSLSEIAEKTRQPLGNVRNHYYRALEKLRRQMFGRRVPVD